MQCNLSDLVYKGDKVSVYAASTASTWIWAPALFVSSATAYYYGLIGLLAFLIPNILCLIIFGYVSSYIVNNQYANVSFLQLIQRASERQKNTHFLIGFTVTLCSTIVQFLGMNIIISTWFSQLDPLIGCAVLSLIALAIIWNGGIKTCIISDYYKWVIIAAASVIMFSYVGLTTPFSFDQLKVFDPVDLDYLIGFGITTAIGLLTSPYVDQTMWQRAFCSDSKSIIKTFLLAALMFAIVPLCFGLTAMIFAASSSIVPGWEITNAIGTGWLGIILAIAIFFTLLSTLDSNMCAIDNYIRTEFEIDGRWGIVAVLIVASLIVSYIPVTVTQLFLIYGTIRTVGCVPTLLIGFNQFDEKRLFWGTICGLIFGSLGYLILTILGYPYAFICTIVALLFPLIGYSSLCTSK